METIKIRAVYFLYQTTLKMQIGADSEEREWQQKFLRHKKIRKSTLLQPSSFRKK